MAKIAGVDVLLKVQTGEDGTTGDPIYTDVGGQSGATLNRSTNVIEATAKTDLGWAGNLAGVNSWSIDCEGFIVPDDTALDKLETAWENRETVKAHILMPSGKTYEGDCIISDFPAEFPQDGAVTFSLSLTGTGALAVTPAV